MTEGGGVEAQAGQGEERECIAGAAGVQAVSREGAGAERGGHRARRAPERGNLERGALARAAVARLATAIMRTQQHL